MIDILFCFALTSISILCVMLVKRHKKMQQQLDLVYEYCHFLLESDESSADADGADELSK